MSPLFSIREVLAPASGPEHYVAARNVEKQKTIRVAKPDRLFEPVEPRGQFLQQGVAQQAAVDTE